MTSGRTATERLLRESDSLLLGLLGNALIGIYVIQDDKFAYVNPRLAEMFGYSQDDLCSGMGPLDLTEPGSHEMAQTEIDKRAQGKTHEGSYSFRGTRKDGSFFHAHVLGVASEFGGREAIIGILLDVTEQRRAEHAVSDQLRFLSRLLDTIPSPVFFKDEQGRYLGCNSAFEQFIGIPADALIGRAVFDISPPDLAARYLAADQAMFDQPGTQTYEAAVVYADGTRHDVVFYKATFNKADGSLGGLVGVILDITERKRLERAIWKEAHFDPLTGLPNRRRFHEAVRSELDMAKFGERLVALLFIDLDRFKDVNDTLGHDLGDLLLVEAAHRIRSALGELGSAFRLGGDEFVIVLSTPGSRVVASQVAERIILALCRPFELDGHRVYVSASIGISCHPDDALDAEKLVSYADQAMYAAKAAGRNCYRYFSASMQELARQRLHFSNDIRRALSARQFEIYYQPIVEMQGLKVVKAEALLRWNTSERGQVGPAEFIPIAEDIGIIDEIGNWVFDEVVQVAKRLNSATSLSGAEPLQISVNVSPRQLLASGHAPWIARLRELELDPRCIAVEITEGLLLDARPAVTSALIAFRDAGIDISIDDFGTGYSAMSYLKKFQIDYLKIDCSFVRDLSTDPSDLAIAEAMIVMAHKLGIKVVAEGVETSDQLRLLRDAGCDFAQGYLFSRPVPLAEFVRLLAEALPDARSGRCDLAKRCE